jgi:hypothetical protein
MEKIDFLVVAYTSEATTYQMRREKGRKPPIVRWINAYVGVG